MSEFAGTIWRWAAIAALLVVGAIAVIAIRVDDDEGAPAGLSSPPAAREEARGASRGECGTIERLLAAAALLPDDICTRRAAVDPPPQGTPR